MRFLLLILTGLFSFSVLAAQAPLLPEVESRFKALENKHIVRVNYNFSSMGGSTGTYHLGKYLPAKAVITNTWFRVDAAFTDSGVGTFTLQCEDTGNIYGPADITGQSLNALVAGSAINTVATMVDSIAASCPIDAVIAGTALTAGKLTLWVEYVIKD